MIVRERTHDYIMIKQHDHAYLSGEIAAHLNDDKLKSDHLYEDVIYAAYEHDRSWIIMDETPIWNDQQHTPYSFTDYPLALKLACYTIGINEVEKCSPYAALLCSLHYSEFFKSTKEKDAIRFRDQERKRQKKVKNQLKLADEELLSQHLRVIQFCDRLSLYVCLNEPGISKGQELVWYKNGFTDSEIFSDNRHPISASWLNDHQIHINSSIINKKFSCVLQTKAVLKKAIHDFGIVKAYNRSEWIEQSIQFC